jgi:hypothetical protein
VCRAKREPFTGNVEKISSGAQMWRKGPVINALSLEGNCAASVPLKEGLIVTSQHVIVQTV